MKWFRYHTLTQTYLLLLSGEIHTSHSGALPDHILHSYPTSDAIADGPSDSHVQITEQPSGSTVRLTTRKNFATIYPRHWRGARGVRTMVGPSKLG